MKEALIFLAAAVVCVPIAARLGLGSVLGYLIAGALIGPWGLGLIAGIESIQGLAELGVALMLFVIGLELDPRRMLAMRKEVFRGGATSSRCVAALSVPRSGPRAHVAGRVVLDWRWRSRPRPSR